MDIINDWLDDIPQQFKSKRNIEILISAFSRQLQDLKNVFNDLVTKLDIDVATGKNLDLIGNIVTLTRKEAGEMLNTGNYIKDEEYRKLLKYKICINTSECTYADIVGAVKSFVNTDVMYREEQPATIILQLPHSDRDGKKIKIGSLQIIKAAGVKVVFSYSNYANGKITVAGIVKREV